MLNINAISDVQSADIDIKDPVSGASVGATITLAGPEHPARKALEFARQRKARAALQKTGKVQLGDPADDEQDNIEFLAACTLGWSGIADGATEIEFSPAAALKLYSNEALQWLVVQLTRALGERERFINSSAQA